MAYIRLPTVEALDYMIWSISATSSSVFGDWSLVNLNSTPRGRSVLPILEH